MEYRITKGLAEKLTAGRIKAIEGGTAPVRPKDVDRRECWIKLEITQHSPEGERKDTIMAYMAHDRSDSFNIKDGKLMIIKENGKGLVKKGAHRFMAWIAKEKLTTFGMG